MPSLRRIVAPDELLRFVEAAIGAASTAQISHEVVFTTTNSGSFTVSTSPTMSQEELTMRTQNRDALCQHLDSLVEAASRTARDLRAREARSITNSMLEAHVSDIVARVDAAFTVANPAMSDSVAE